MIRSAATCALVLAASATVPSVAAEYDNLDLVQDRIQQLADTSGGNATSSLLTDSGGSVIETVGVDGPPAVRRNIWLLEIAKAGGSDRPNVLLTGTQHAREWIAYRVVLDAAEFVLGRLEDETWPVGDTRFDHFRLFKAMNIQSLTDPADIFVVPVVNPEGYQYSFANDPPSPYAPGEHGWRKNRRDVLATR